LAPKAVPDDKIQSFHDSIRIVLTDPSVKNQLRAFGVSSSHILPEQFDRLLSNDWNKALDMIRRLKLQSF
jgi:tripartite-type tricarboxylate transporter receptor subunit TctC